jgi:hypothetical protein
VISKRNQKQHNAKTKYEMVLLRFCRAALCRTVPLVKAYVTPPVLLTAFPKGLPAPVTVGTLRRPALLIRARLGLPCAFVNLDCRADQQTGMQHIVSS